MNPFALIVAGPLVVGAVLAVGDSPPVEEPDSTSLLEQHLRGEALRFLEGGADSTGTDTDELALWLDAPKTTVKIAPLDGMPIVVPNLDRFAMPHHVPSGTFSMPLVNPSPSPELKNTEPSDQRTLR